MFKVNRLRELQQVAQNPTESEYVQALVTILTELEHRQLEAVEQLHDAAGIEGVEVTSTREEREQQLIDLVDAVASGSFEDYWFREVVGEHIEQPDAAQAYAGLSEEEWQTQLETWADGYLSRNERQFEGISDRKIAAVHVKNVFGVSLGEFEREVVGFERKEALRAVLAGNFEAVEAGISAATAEVNADE